ncbi:MAG TPA: PQQ-dependent sugar dehydrogenase [Thermoanaerobaculia bacterium]
MRLLRTGLILALLAAGPLAAAVPAGFTDALVTNVSLPTALAFTPDGRLLITTQPGALRVYQGGALLATPALTFPDGSICTESERGLLGVAVHPSFASNHFIYLFYTANEPNVGCVNRVSRFMLPDNNVINAASELVLVDNMPSPNGNHNAGDLHFGKDGNLYISIGDGGPSSNARLKHVLTGKILRVTADGGIPIDNPFQGPGTASCRTGPTTDGNKCQETFAWGFRNPFRMAFDPNAAGTRFFINDVGAGSWEEIDLGQAGADYGWNLCEGSHTPGSTAPCSSAPPGMVQPIFEYLHNTRVPGTTSPTNCNSITGGAFVPNGLWPGFDNSYLFSDFICGWIFKLTNSGGTWTASDFATNLGGGSAVHLAFGPHGSGQALYYTTYAGAGGGQVRRISIEPRTTEPLDFHTVQACRLIDTRQPAGPFGGPALAAGQTRLFNVTGSCGVPATAKAVAVNFAVANPGTSGFLRIYPADEAGTATSAINFPAGRTRTNNAVLFLGAVGNVAVSCVSSGPAHFVLDVVGYFE